MSKLWIGLISLSAILALWFSGKASIELWKYLKLNASAPATVSEWSVEQRSANVFVISGKYFFDTAGRRWDSSSVLSGHTYPNPYAAQRAIEPLQTQAWQVWYCQKDPSYSTLQKFFPFKRVFQALIALGVTIYFAGIRFFLVRFA